MAAIYSFITRFQTNDEIDYDYIIISRKHPWNYLASYLDNSSVVLDLLAF